MFIRLATDLAEDPRSNEGNWQMWCFGLHQATALEFYTMGFRNAMKALTNSFGESHKILCEMTHSVSLGLYLIYPPMIHFPKLNFPSIVARVT